MLKIFPIALELIIVAVALQIGVQKKRIYGYGLALTFSIYVLFDSARTFGLAISTTVLDVLFLIATLSALWSVIELYKEKKK